MCRGGSISALQPFEQLLRIADGGRQSNALCTTTGDALQPFQY